MVGTFPASRLPTRSPRPLAGLMEQKVDEGHQELQCMKVTLPASMQGYAPQVAVEFGRKAAVLDRAAGPSASSREATSRTGQEGLNPG